MKEEAYGRAFVKENEIVLKIDFVNNVGFHAGGITESTLYHRTNGWKNILSNKITALSRGEGKDAADILYLCYKYPFNWMEVINDAKNKDSWIDEVNASKFLSEFDQRKLERVKWMNPPNFEEMLRHLKTIAKDILLGVDNSLVKMNA